MEEIQELQNEDSEDEYQLDVLQQEEAKLEVRMNSSCTNSAASLVEVKAFVERYIQHKLSKASRLFEIRKMLYLMRWLKPSRQSLRILLI